MAGRRSGSAETDDPPACGDGVDPVTPMEAVRREVEIELDALARRLGSAVPRSVTIRVEFDDRTGVIRAVECEEQRRRTVLGGTLPAQVKRRTSVA